MARYSRYTVSSTDEFIRDMCNRGWEGVQLNDGVLGVGDWVLIAPNEHKWNFVIKEVYVGPYTSAQTIRRCRKISQELQRKIDKIMRCAYD